MGFWGTGPFENDAAADFVGEVLEKGKPGLARAALSRVVTQRRGDLEDWPAAEGVAAAELVAAARGHAHPSCSDELRAWAAKARAAATDGFAKLAANAIARIRDDSELTDAWKEEGLIAAWNRYLAGLIARLAKTPKPLKVKASLQTQTPAEKDQRAAMAALKKKRVVFLKKGKMFICICSPHTNRMRLRDSDYKHFAALGELTHLKFSGPKDDISDSGARQLRHLANLINLQLESERLTDASADIFAGMKKLRDLSLHSSGFGDGAAEHIARLPALRDLDLAQTGVTDAGVHHLSACRKLQYLHLERTAITDKSLSVIAGLSALRGLFLARTNVSSKGVNQLKGLTMLTGLTLEHTQVGDQACETIGSFARLQNLTLGHTQVTSKGVKKLVGLKRLERIELDGLPLTDDDVETLRTFPKRTGLSLENTKISYDGIRCLKQDGRFVFAGFDRDV